MRHHFWCGPSVAMMVLALAACSKQQSRTDPAPAATAESSSAADRATSRSAPESQMSESASADAAAPAVDRAGTPVAAAKTEQKPASPLPMPVPVQLAYRYLVKLELPTDSVAGVARSHQRECEAAGPAVCQVLGATENINDDIAAAELTLRAQPQWLTKFRDTVLTSAKENKGRVIHTNTETEDMSAQMTDTQAYLQSRQVLRARLMEQLKSQDGDRDELTALQEQIDDIQQEIDTTRARLEHLQDQVVMANMTINYQSPGAIITADTFGESRSAVQASVANFATSLQILIQIAGFFIPWLMLGGAGYYAFRKTRQLKARKATHAAA